MNRVTRRPVLTLLLVALSAIAITAGGSQSPREMFERARLLEATKQNPAELIKLYEQVAVAAEKSDPALAAAARERVARLKAAQAPFAVRSLDADVASVGFAFARQVSPNGRRLLVFKPTNSPTAPLAFAIRDLESGDEWPIAADLPGSAGNAPVFSWSDDSKGIAIVQRSLVGDRVRNTVAVASAEPRSPAAVIVTTLETSQQAFASIRGAEVPRWSPDGQWLPYLVPAPTTAGAFDVHVMHVASGKSRPLGVQVERQPQFTWSPDSRLLAMRVTNATASAVNEVRVVTVSSGESRAVRLPQGATLGQHGWQANWRPQWLPGNRVEIRHPDSTQPGVTIVSLLSLDTGEVVPTCRTTGDGGLGEAFPYRNPFSTGDSDLCLGFTVDGNRQIVWRHATQRIMVRDIRSGTERPLTSGSGGEEHSPFLSPDGRIEVFVSNRDGEWGLYAAPVDPSVPSSPVLITRLRTVPILFEVSWTSDGFSARIAYTESAVWRVDLDPATMRPRGTTERLTQDSVQNYAASVSPDGRQIAYISRDGARVRLALMNADGSNERTVSGEQVLLSVVPMTWRSANEVLVTGAALRPATGTGVAEFRQEAVSVDLRNGTVKPHSLPAASVGLAGWAINGATNEAVRLDRGEATGSAFRARSLTDGRERIIASVDVDPTLVRQFLPSPDGTRVAFQVARGSGELWIAEAQGEPRIVVRRMANPAAWAPNGRHLLVRSAGQPQIVDTTTGESWPLTAQPLPARSSGGSWAPDGSFVVLTLEPDPENEYRLFRGVTYDGLTKPRRN